MGGSSYFAFVKEKRPEVVAKYPNLKVTEISKKLGEMWKSVSPAEKEAYKAIAAKSSGSSSSSKKKGAASPKPKGKKGKKGSDDSD
jgi:hypothetical protein